MLGVDLHAPLTEDEANRIMDSIAGGIVSRRLETPAVLLLEMHKPLSFIASQAVLVAMPMLGPIIGAQSMADLSKLLAKRENIDLLISRIEDMAAARDATDAHAANAGSNQ